MIFPSYHQSSEISPPCKGAFDFPSSLRAAPGSSVLGRRLGLVFSMGANQLNTASCQSSAQGIGVGGLVVDQPRRIFPWPSPSGSRHGDLLQGRFNQPDFGRGRRVQVVSQRKPLAVCHHPPLRTLSAFGLADTGPPFFAGAKLPSANVSAPSSGPCSSSGPSNARHAFSQMPCASPVRNRRQHVLGEGYRSGRSFHRAPLRNTHKMPSNTGRLAMGLGPPLGDAFGAGRSGAIGAHCASVNSDVCRDMDTSCWEGKHTGMATTEKDQNPAQVMKPLLGKLLPTLIQTRSVNLRKRACALPGLTKIDSQYRRLQRFFSRGLCPSVFTRLIVDQLVVAGQPLLLVLDRTHWPLGQTDLNLLCLGLVFQGVSIPLIRLVAATTRQLPYARTQTSDATGTCLFKRLDLLSISRPRIHWQRLVSLSAAATRRFFGDPYSRQRLGHPRRWATALPSVEDPLLETRDDRHVLQCHALPIAVLESRRPSPPQRRAAVR